jgi:hypothetical protein
MYPLRGCAGIRFLPHPRRSAKSPDFVVLKARLLPSMPAGGRLLAKTLRRTGARGQSPLVGNKRTVGITYNCASPLSPPLLRGGRGCVMVTPMQQSMAGHRNRDGSLHLPRPPPAPIPFEDFPHKGKKEVKHSSEGKASYWLTWPCRLPPTRGLAPLSNTPLSNARRTTSPNGRRCMGVT